MLRWSRAVLCCCALWHARGASRVELKIQLGHSDSITSATFSPDGRSVLTTGDVTARLWDRASGRELRRFTGHSKNVTSAAFSPDGTRVITGSEDETARIWDVSTGRELSRIEPKEGAVSSVAFAPDGVRVAIVPFSPGTIIWSLSTGRELLRVERYCAGATSVSFSKDGRSVLTACANTATLWDATSGDAIRQVQTEDPLVTVHPVLAAALSQDSRTIVTGSRGNVRLWDVRSGSMISRIDVDGYSVAFAPDGKSVLAGGITVARLVEVSSGRELRSFPVTPGNRVPVTTVAFSSDGQAALAGSSYPTVALWDVPSGRELRRYEGQPPVVGASISPDGRSLLTTGCTPQVPQWDLASGRQLRRFLGKNRGICFVSITADGRLIATGGVTEQPTEDGVEVWDAITGKQVQRSNEYSNLEAIALSPDGRFLLTSMGAGEQQHRVALTDRVSGKRVWGFDNSLMVQSLAFSADGKLALAGSNDRTARLLDVASGKELRRVEIGEPVFSVSFSPDGKLFLTVGSGSDGGATAVWEVATARQVRRFASGEQGPRAVFSADGRSVLTTDANSARILDIGSGRELRRLDGHTGKVMSAEFSPDSRWILTASLDGTSRIWDAPTGRLLAVLVSFRDGGWAVVDPEGRYDAADPGNSPGLYWMLGSEVIELSQLKQRFYAPGLLARILGFKKEPLPPVAGLDQLQAAPVIEIVPPKAGQTAASVRVRSGGRGIGRLMVKVNGRTVPLSTRGNAIDPNAATAEIPIDLSQAELAANGKNKIEVVAFDRDSLVSRGYEAVWEREPEKASAPPTLFVIIAGVSNFDSPALNLSFPAKDALDMAKAISVGGAGLFGVERVHISTFASGTQQEPTKANIRKAFEEVARRAGAEDVLLMYFAGHGIAGKTERDAYYFLTREARSLEPESDPQLRAQSTISSAELLEWLRQKGMPLRQVVVLDTCAAGAATAELLKLAEPRELSADQQRAMELLKDNTGSHILMGAASDKVSYEASRYGQGLLTYALLLGMRGEALDEGGRLDVRKWFDLAERRVPELARGIGGIQTPVVSSPSGQTFPIALLKREDWDQIPLAHVKPQLLRVTCLDEDDTDRLQLGPPLRAALRAASIPATRGAAREEPPLVYLDQVAGDVADAYIPQVRYWIESDHVRARVRLLGGAQRIERTIEIPGKDPAQLAQRISREIIGILPEVK